VIGDIAQEKRDKAEDSEWAVSKAKQFNVRGNEIHTNRVIPAVPTVSISRLNNVYTEHLSPRPTK
jgi:hypothetical protein